METTVRLELVIFIICCALLPTLTVPKLTDVGLTVICVDASDVLLPEIKNNNSITATRTAKHFFFDISDLSVSGRGLRRNNNSPGPLDFHDRGSLRIGREQRLLVWRHARGQGATLSLSCTGCNAGLN